MNFHAPALLRAGGPEHRFLVPRGPSLQHLRPGNEIEIDCLERKRRVANAPFVKENTAICGRERSSSLDAARGGP